MEVLFTERLHRAAVDVSKLPDVSKDLRSRLQPFIQEDKAQWPHAIAFQIVKDIHQQLSLKPDKDNGNDVYLHQLLLGSELHRECYQPPKRNPQLVARLEKLKAQQEQREYEQMVENIKPKKSVRETLGQDIRSTRQQLSSVANFIITVVSAFAFGFFASQYAFPNVAYRVLFALFLAILVAAADLYFMARIEI